MSDTVKWQHVCEVPAGTKWSRSCTYRLLVPGGWIYMTVIGNEQATKVFVPDTAGGDK